MPLGGACILIHVGGAWCQPRQPLAILSKKLVSWYGYRARKVTRPLFGSVKMRRTAEETSGIPGYSCAFCETTISKSAELENEKYRGEGEI